jgi:hypothetical protein
MDFVCRESINEWLYPRAGVRPTFSGLRFFAPGRRETHRFVYDYQLVRDRTGAIRETRTLLKRDKQSLRVPEARLETRLFWHSGIVAGPLGLLSREYQAGHDYRALREDKIGEDRVLVIEAVPKADARPDHLVGTVWMRLEDASVLRIEWDPSSMDNYALTEQTAERLKMDPRIIMTSEFAFEKNGIRFPSRFTLKEIYKRGVSRFERSQIDVVYDQYRFFTVETQVIY